MFLRTKLKCYVYYPIPCNWPSLSIGHQTVTIMNHCCYYFDNPLERECPVCYFHVTYAFQSEYTVFGSMNVKERLPQKKRNI